MVLKKIKRFKRTFVRLPRIFFPRPRFKKFKKNRIFRFNFIKFTRFNSKQSKPLQLGRKRNFIRRQVILKFLSWKFNLVKSALVLSLNSSNNRHWDKTLSLYHYLNFRLDVIMSRWLAPINLKPIHNLISMGWVSTNGNKIFLTDTILNLGDSVQTTLWNRSIKKLRNILRTELTSGGIIKRNGLRYDLSSVKYKKTFYSRNVKLVGNIENSNTFFGFTNKSLISTRYLSKQRNVSTLKVLMGWKFKQFRKVFFRPSLNFCKNRVKRNRNYAFYLLRRKLKFPASTRLKKNNKKFRYTKKNYSFKLKTTKISKQYFYFKLAKHSNYKKIMKSAINKSALKNLFYCFNIRKERVKAHTKIKSTGIRPIGLHTIFLKRTKTFSNVSVLNFTLNKELTYIDYKFNSLNSNTKLWKDPIFITSLDVHSYYLNKGLNRFL